MTIHTWLSFLIASILISLTPGAGAVSSMSSGLSYGFKRGIWNALGLQLALAVQLIVVAAGLGALLATSDLAFTVIKWFGVAYLIYLAYRQWTAPISPGRECSDEAGSSPMVSRSHLFWRGFVINASNPKAILFILAVVPQFLNIENALGMQYFVLGLTMVVVDLLVMGATRPWQPAYDCCSERLFI
ncbi:LysE family transporter [Paenalcaligenes niemegkensis]|uniref:LysE family transporter n=1 Tax=Paenalcaligenes niemegkensis TaxID=2895469 RepID=UPI001EE8C71E|nr:LysE family transporter [Paenalcaligenes niemegkensis]MCQ9616805.1 LysE family transporter [Paenalcaligenes niemegkensis]